MKGKARCRNHGGKSTGARTAAGLAKLSALHWKHGRCTKAAKAEAKRRAQVGREIRAELRDIEQGGHRFRGVGQGLARRLEARLSFDLNILSKRTKDREKRLFSRLPRCNTDISLSEVPRSSDLGSNQAGRRLAGTGNIAALHCQTEL